MDLPALKFNRQLYRSSSEADESPEYMSSQVYSAKEAGARNSADKNKKDAKEVITGTVITACLIKSSDQDDRIEIGQNLESVLNQVNTGSLVFNSQIKSLDYLVAYRPGGRLGLILTGIGAVYVGYQLPAIKAIHIDSSGPLMYQTQSEHTWTFTHPGTGKYRIRHNLNSLNYVISAIATVPSGDGSPVFCSIGNKGLNTFDVDIFDLSVTLQDNDFDCIVEVFND